MFHHCGRQQSRHIRRCPRFSDSRDLSADGHSSQPSEYAGTRSQPFQSLPGQRRIHRRSQSRRHRIDSFRNSQSRARAWALYRAAYLRHRLGGCQRGAPFAQPVRSRRDGSVARNGRAKGRAPSSSCPSEPHVDRRRPHRKRQRNRRPAGRRHSLRLRQRSAPLADLDSPLQFTYLGIRAVPQLFPGQKTPHLLCCNRRSLLRRLPCSAGEMRCHHKILKPQQRRPRRQRLLGKNIRCSRKQVARAQCVREGVVVHQRPARTVHHHRSLLQLRNLARSQNAARLLRLSRVQRNNVRPPQKFGQFHLLHIVTGIQLCKRIVDQDLRSKPTQNASHDPADRSISDEPHCGRFQLETGRLPRVVALPFAASNRRIGGRNSPQRTQHHRDRMLRGCRRIARGRIGNCHTASGRRSHVHVYRPSATHDKQSQVGRGLKHFLRQRSVVGHADFHPAQFVDHLLFRARRFPHLRDISKRLQRKRSRCFDHIERIGNVCKLEPHQLRSNKVIANYKKFFTAHIASYLFPTGFFTTKRSVE